MSDQGRPIVGVEWLGQCYDIVELDPLALSESNKTQGRVFHVNAGGASDEEVGGYRVPTGVLLSNVFKTEIRTTKEVIFDSFDFRSSMINDFGVTAKFEGLFELSASASNKDVEERTASRERVMKFAMMMRAYQHVALRRTADPTREPELDAAKLRPWLSKAFASAVAALPAQESSVYRTFIETFGTHFVAELTLGGVAYEELSIDEREIADGKLSESTLEMVAKAGLEGFEAGATAREATEHARKTDAKYRIERSEIKFVGGKGGTELQSSWIAEVDAEPAPIFPRSDFARLTAALTAGFFPDDPQIEVKRQLLDDAIDLYVIEKGGKAGRFVHFGEGTGLVGARSGVEYVRASTLAHFDRIPSDPAQIFLEPADDHSFDGTVVHTGRARPVRIRVTTERRGDLGYLERTNDRNMFSDGTHYFTTTLTTRPDPERSRWFISSSPAKPGVRPLVFGEPVTISCEAPGTNGPVGALIGPGDWLVNVEGQYGHVVRFKAAAP
ncbi:MULTISPECIES: MAC/perforin domain-containing protein [Sorangium]|uniref:MAC/perforin domain-containing protein n=1 Tax=Sorangium TaxID=39643 RepID=UPI003D9C097E